MPEITPKTISLRENKFQSWIICSLQQPHILETAKLVLRSLVMEDLLNILGQLLSVVTAIGNGFVVLLIAKNHRLYSSANQFVLSLAVADFGVGIAVFPLSYFCNYSMACNLRVYVAFFWFFLHSSVTNLCSLTWDRYIAIVYPLKYNTSMTPCPLLFVIYSSKLFNIVNRLTCPTYMPMLMTLSYIWPLNPVITPMKLLLCHPYNSAFVIYRTGC